jgi:hypothetical protein
MFHQRTENKMHAPTENKVAPDSITIDGKKYDRARYEDPANPGHTVPGRLYLSAELRACEAWGLAGPSGRPIRISTVERPPDPSHVGRKDAPAALRADADEAWTKLYAIRARAAAALERRALAEAAQQSHAKARNRQGFEQAVSDAAAAEQDRRDIELEEGPVKRALSAAELAIRAWTWDETLRRQGRA